MRYADPTDPNSTGRLMAHLWTQVGGGALGILELAGDRLELDRLAERIDGEKPGGRARGPVPAGRLQRFAAESDEWILLAAPRAGISINGLPLQVGIHVLADRDEIRIGGRGSVFFSTERPARCEPLPPSDRSLVCPRCRQPIEPGTPAVRCPQCALWHHQSADLPCWSYAPTCALCPRSTEQDAGFQWTPEDL